MENIPTIEFNPVFQGRAVSGSSPGTVDTSLVGRQRSGFSLGQLGQMALNSFGSLGSVLNGLGSLGSSLLNNYAEDKRAQLQRDWSESMMDKQNQWNLDMWNMSNAYNSAGAQVQRLKDAGLNPMNYGVGQFSADPMQSADADYSRASNPNGIANPVASALQGAQLSKSIELADAQIAKTKSETDATTLDNEFKQKTMNARVEGESLANRLTNSQILQINSQRQKIAAEIKKIAAETESEFERKILYQAETNLKKMQATEIAKLLPYKQALMAAETENQRQQAALAAANAMIQQGLLDKGIVDVMYNDADAQLQLKLKQVESEEERKRLYDAQRRMSEWREQVLKGNIFELSDNPMDPDNLGKGMLNGLFNAVSIITTAVGAPFTKLLGL